MFFPWTDSSLFWTKWCSACCYEHFIARSAVTTKCRSPGCFRQHCKAEVCRTIKQILFTHNISSVHCIVKYFGIILSFCKHFNVWSLINASVHFCLWNTGQVQWTLKLCRPPDSITSDKQSWCLVTSYSCANNVMSTDYNPVIIFNIKKENLCYKYRFLHSPRSLSCLRINWNALSVHLVQTTLSENILTDWLSLSHLKPYMHLQSKCKHPF